MRPGTLERIGTERLISFQILGFYGCYSTVEQLFDAKLRKNCAKRCECLTTDSPSVATPCKTVQDYVELVRPFRSQMLYPVELRAPERESLNLRSNDRTVKSCWKKIRPL